MKVLFACLGLSLLTACASVKTDPEFAAPTCEAYRECQAKWDAAAAWINRYSGKPVAMRTETEMRNDMSAGLSNYITVSVEKVRLPDGGWRIDADMRCAKRVGCNPSAWEANRHFTRFVNRAWHVPEAADGGSSANDDD